MILTAMTGCSDQAVTSTVREAPTEASASVVEASPTAAETTPPHVLGVRCTDEGTVLAGTTVATSVDGVHLRVSDETSGRGASIQYGFAGQMIGGNLLDKPDTDLGFAPPPGTAEVSCWPDGAHTSDTPVVLRVIDPDDNYRPPTTPQDLGCEPAGEGYPTIHDGATAEAAVQAAIDWEADGYSYTVRRTSGGYWRLPGYGFVLDRDGHAWAAGGVSRVDGHWQASLTTLCAAA